MPEPENKPLVNELNAKKAIVAGTVNGNIIVNSTTIHQYQEVKRKSWRELTHFAYPTQILEIALATYFPGHLVIQLHRTFRETGYIDFTSLVSINNEMIMNENVWGIDLIGHQARYTGGLYNNMKILWGSSPDRVAFQDAINSELRDLYDKWIVTCEILNEPGPIAYRFIYDLEGLRISIKPHEEVSTQPSEYPNKLANTSELLMFLSAVWRSPLLFVGEIMTVLHSYCLSKLMLDIMDRKLDIQRVRINVNDPEEWDYLNPKADLEFRRYTNE